MIGQNTENAYVYEELESSSQNSLSSTVSSIDLNDNRFNVKRIRYNCNRPRITHEEYLGAIAFDVIWEDNTETREPIQNLIDIENKTINDSIIDILHDYIKTARDFPSNNRCCIMCYNKVHNGSFMCHIHNKIFSFLH